MIRHNIHIYFIIKKFIIIDLEGEISYETFRKTGTMLHWIDCQKFQPLLKAHLKAFKA